MKKILAFVLAMIMVMAMTTVAFAADLDPTEAGNGHGTSTTATSVTIKKAIEVTNNSGYGAYGPTITYTYTISSVAGATGTTVSDDANPPVTVTLKPGVMDAVDSATKTAVFSNTETATSDKITKDLTWTFDVTKFPSAGVYRYQIAETNAVPAPASIGVERPTNYDASKFLDVYVRNATGGGLEIYGYAFVDDEEAAITSSSVKSTGWDSGDDLDKYETYNITVTKKITGSGADMTAEFPFQVVLTGKMDSAKIETAGTGASITAFNATSMASSATITGALGNNETLIINGLPKTVTYTVDESNPTVDTYAVTITTAGDTQSTKVEGNLTGSQANKSLITGGNVNNATGEITIEVTNNLDSVSPTGVILRVAPFAIMLVAGVVLLGLTKKSKSNED